MDRNKDTAKAQVTADDRVAHKHTGRGSCSSGEMQKENIDTKYGNGYYRQRNGQKHGHKEGTGDSRQHKGELYIGFPLTRPLFLRTGNSLIQGSQIMR